jgi:hypothetical protein
LLVFLPILILAATAVVSCRSDGGLTRGGTESYPATYAIPLNESDASFRAMDAALMRSPYAQSKDKEKESVSGLDDWREFLGGRRRWSRVSLPQRVSAVIPRVEVFLVTGEGRIGQMAAVLGGHVYWLPGDVNQMLWDCGMRFRAIDIQRWVPVVVYFVVAARRFYLGEGTASSLDRARLEQSYNLIMQGTKPLVPTLKVNGFATEMSDRRQTVNPMVTGAGHVAIISVSCEVAGVPESTRIYTQGGSHVAGRIFPWHLRGKGLEWDWLPLPALGDTKTQEDDPGGIPGAR